MDSPQDDALLDRVERLETAVEDLQRQLTRLRVGVGAATQPARPATSPIPAREAISQPAAPSRSAGPTSPLIQGETWLKLTGIALVLLGVAFLFKYSIDQGWLTESVRVGLALALGAVLFAVGLRVHPHRRSFSQVLLGGGIAVYYITGFAAFQLYHLVAHPVAFAFMVAVTLLAFFLSLRQREAVLSLIGTAGGLGTPFLLYTGSGNLPGLVGYSCLILAGSSAVYLYKGWRSLLVTSVAGGWLVLLVGHGGIPFQPWAAQTARLALQMGVVFSLLAFWVVPLAREILVAADPARWPVPPVPRVLAEVAGKIPYVLSVSTPLIALTLSAAIWSQPENTWGWVAAAGSVVFGVVSRLIRSRVPNLAYAQGLVGLLLLTLAFCLLLEGNALFLTIAGEATVLHCLSRRLQDKGTSICGHALFAMAGLVLAVRLVNLEVVGTPVLNSTGLTHLAIIAAALVAAVAQRTTAERLTYCGLAHVLFLGWILRELSPVEGGQGYVSIIWGVYAIGLLVAGLRLDLHPLRLAGLGTLALVVAKLFLVDLARLEALWRILLFLGFGGVFLVISYYFQSLWKAGSSSE
ncbi:DUF2339 domain-containing protein [Candidatus Latescibacterota bacterium]